MPLSQLDSLAQLDRGILQYHLPVLPHIMTQPARRSSPPKNPPKQSAVAPLDLWDKLDALGPAGPASKWRKVPVDMAENVKHYLYGQPKR